MNTIHNNISHEMIWWPLQSKWFINVCNKDILSLWRGNVDLQYVINEIATVKYVCSYMAKGEKGMGETLKRVAKECQNETIRTQMNKIKKEFLGKYVLGAPESAM